MVVSVVPGVTAEGLSVLDAAEPLSELGSPTPGYKAHNAPERHTLKVFTSGQKRGVHGHIKRDLRRRAAVERLIAIASGCALRTNEVRRVSMANPKGSDWAKIEARGMRHAGRPAI